MMMTEKGKIIVRKSKKGKPISEILIDGVKNPMVLPSNYEPFDESLNGRECEIIREKGQIVKVIIDNKGHKKKLKASSFGKQKRIDNNGRISDERNVSRRGTKQAIHKDILDKDLLQLPDETKALLTETNKMENLSIALNRCIAWEKHKIVNNFLKEIEFMVKNCLSSLFPQLSTRSNTFLNFFKKKYFTVSFTAKADWRMVVGLGAENVHETSMALHHIYGIPYIPGSALKGIARDAAVADLCSEVKNEKPDVMDALISMPTSDEKDEDKRWKEIKKNGKVKRQNKDSVEPEKTTINKIIKGWPDFETARKVFGGQKQAGKVIFFDAFPEKDVSIKLDIMNPHYPKYYSGDEAPTDWQNPNPIKFLTVENTAFSFALALNKKETDQNRTKIDSNPALLNAAEKWMRKALEEQGVGAKTSVGYGYFQELSLRN
jgi:CRISPR-associated protein Cmr6